jgi:hypothetical protein
MMIGLTPPPFRANAYSLRKFCRSPRFLALFFPFYLHFPVTYPLSFLSHFPLFLFFIFIYQMILTGGLGVFQYTDPWIELVPFTTFQYSCSVFRFCYIYKALPPLVGHPTVFCHPRWQPRNRHRIGRQRSPLCVYLAHSWATLNQNLTALHVNR